MWYKICQTVPTNSRALFNDNGKSVIGRIVGQQKGMTGGLLYVIHFSNGLKKPVPMQSVQIIGDPPANIALGTNVEYVFNGNIYTAKVNNFSGSQVQVIEHSGRVLTIPVDHIIRTVA